MDVNPESKNDITVFRIKYTPNKDWEQWILLKSDEHFDSKHCDRKLLKKHHEQAKERNALILSFGDTMDMMQGRYDPRGSKVDIRPEYLVDNYFDAIAEDAIKFYEPYRNNIKFIATGNHELSVLQRQEVDVLNTIAKGLGLKKSPYSGFIRFQFERKKGGGRQSTLMYYNHGSGGNAPVTRGVIKTNRRQDYISADIFVSGHIHNHWIVPRPMVHVSEQGKIKKREQMHISLGTYKDHSIGSSSWEDQKEFPPPSMGGVWLRFYHENKEIKFETIKAN